MTTQLQLGKPCSNDWDAMRPVAGGRHCRDCNKTVVDLSDLDADAARLRFAEVRASLLDGNEICARVWVQGDSLAVTTRPRPSPMLSPAMVTRQSTPGLRRRLLTNGMAAVLSVAIAGSLGSGPVIGAEGGMALPSPCNPPALPLGAQTSANSATAPTPAHVPESATAPRMRLSGVLIAPPSPPQAAGPEAMVLPAPQRDAPITRDQTSAAPPPSPAPI